MSAFTWACQIFHTTSVLDTAQGTRQTLKSSGISPNLPSFTWISHISTTKNPLIYRTKPSQRIRIIPSKIQLQFKSTIFSRCQKLSKSLHRCIIFSIIHDVDFVHTHDRPLRHSGNIMWFIIRFLKQVDVSTQWDVTRINKVSML